VTFSQVEVSSGKHQSEKQEKRVTYLFVEVSSCQNKETSPFDTALLATGKQTEVVLAMPR
jgi:hypothetical protein